MGKYGSTVVLVCQSQTFQYISIGFGVHKKGAYVHLVHAKIDYFHFVSYKNYCIRGGVSALTDGDYHFEITKLFYLDASNLQIYTNIANYSRTGRYVLIVKR
ncbi:uncharacterized protein [Clytia hemisphaerica]|uniref:uncharacterized protein isoform X2 n=1 Tax=Clytia hemisphaerica TaxID=252671 RepID=UPI0034D5A1AF